MKKLKALIQELYQDRKQLIFLAVIFSVGAYLDSFIPRDPHIQQAWVGVALAAIQAGVGIWQAVEGSKMAKGAERPEYETPQAMLDAMTLAERKAFEGLPPEVKKEFMQASQRMTAASLRQVGERRGGLGVIPQLYQKQMEGARQLSLMDVAAREKNLANLQQMRMKMAPYQQQEWQWEKAEPYQQTMATAAALQGAGMKNIMGGISTGVMAAGGGFNKNNGEDNSNDENNNNSDNPSARKGNIKVNELLKSSNIATPDVVETKNLELITPTFNQQDTPFGSYSDLTRKPTQVDLNRYNQSAFKDKMTFEDYFAWEQKAVSGQITGTRYHDGDIVEGNNPNVIGEDVSAVLQEGEVVINADAAKQNVGLLSQINQSTGGNPLQSYTMQTLASQGGGTGLSDDITIQLALDESTPPSGAALNLFSQLEIETTTTGLPTSLVT